MQPRREKALAARIPANTWCALKLKKNANPLPRGWSWRSAARRAAAALDAKKGLYQSGLGFRVHRLRCRRRRQVEASAREGLAPEAAGRAGGSEAWRDGPRRRMRRLEVDDASGCGGGGHGAR
jgi:hypothetical protein